MATGLATIAAELHHFLAEDDAVFWTDSGLTPGWEAALAQVPDRIWKSPERSPAQVLSHLRDRWTAQQRWRPAIALTRRLLAYRRQSCGQNSLEALIELGAMGSLATRTGRLDDALPLLTEAYEGLKEAGGLRFATVAANLGTLELELKRPERAVGFFKSAYEIHSQVGSRTTGALAGQIAELYLMAGRAQEALPYLEVAWSSFKKTLGVLHPRSVVFGNRLVQAYRRVGRDLAIEPILRDFYAAACATGDASLVAERGFYLGAGLRHCGLQEEGYRLLEESIRWTRLAGDPHPALPERLTLWAEIQINERHRLEEGEGVLREALQAEERLYGKSSPQVGVRYAALGYLCSQTERVDEAMGYLDPAVSLLRSTLGDSDPSTVLSVTHLLQILVIKAQEATSRRESDLSKLYVDRALELGVPVLGHGHSLIALIKKL